ncbi:D-alanyl-D-alanine carboxypeptidase [Candidatus Nomurabacteria bacterium]|nr:D-alanyl-D-alanine carboxypeptidase [Candidatus Nomurabacteria bacterium]
MDLWKLKQNKEKIIKGVTFGFLAFVVGVSASYGLASAFAFVSSKFGPEVVVFDPYINQAPYVSLGGPAPEPSSGAELLPEQEEVVDSKSYVVKSGVEFPNTYSKSLLVGDLDNGDIIATKNAEQLFPIASLSKLMTAIVADEVLGTDHQVVVSKNAVATYGAQGRLVAGEKYTAEEIFYPLLLESSNDAAEVIAEAYGRRDFMVKMNEKARSIGLTYTNFEDPSGLDKENKSTAKELFLLAQYIHKFRDYIFDITQLKKYSLGKKTWYNNSRFKNYTYYIGGKNGYTDEAGKTLIALFQLPLEGENGFRNIVIILLNTADTEKDVRSILKFLNENVYFE